MDHERVLSWLRSPFRRTPAAGVGTDHLARNDGPGLRPTTLTGETPIGT